MPFIVPSYDELLNEILTDYVNQFPGADISKGSLIYVKSAAHASAIWGLYKHQEYISAQIYPDTADTVNMEHHAWLRGLARKPGESDSDLLARLLDYIRRPPAGGNKYDYVKWALSITGVKSAYCLPLANGIGTVDLVITADPVLTGSVIPSAELLAQVKVYIDDVRPVTAWGFRVLAVEVLPVMVALVHTGDGCNKPQTIADITAYLDAFSPGQPLYLPQLLNLAIINGADNPQVFVPPASIVPLNYQVIRSGGVGVS